MSFVNGLVLSIGILALGSTAMVFMMLLSISLLKTDADRRLEDEEQAEWCRAHLK